MNWETYLALGDSITIGARSYSGYPELTGQLLEQRLAKQWNVINHSVSGFKAIDLARYIDLHFSTLKTHQASISTILIGTNDIKENTNPDDFKMALNLVVLKAKLLTVNSNVVLLSIPEFQNGIMYPYAISMNAQVEAFNQIIAQMADHHKIRLLKLEYEASHFFDGVHLNRTGNDHFAEQICRFMLNDKEAPND
jgi:lysophospholipase L1-like esterase